MPTLRSGTYGLAIDGSHLIGVDPPNLTEYSGVPGFTLQSLYAVTAGALPPGMSLAQKAVGTGTTNQWGWRGTPTALGVYTATIANMGGGSAGGGGDYQWTISLAPGCPLVELSPAAPDPGLPDGYLGDLYSQRLTASAGVAPYVFELTEFSDPLPDGLTLSADGLLEGTPTTVGNVTFVVRATDDNGCPGVQAYALSIRHALIEIGGAAVTGEIARADFELGLNQRSRAQLVFGDGLLPDRGADVVLFARDRATRIFGGLIMTRRVRGEVPGILGNATEADCLDYSVYFDDAAVTLSYAAPVAVEDVIADVVDQVLGDYGLTYTPVATGLTLEPFSWVDVIVTDAFKQISDKTGVVFRTTPEKALDVFVPGTDAAPLTITDANINAFDLSWADGPRLPANTVELLCGPAGPGLIGQRWVADGIASSWVTDLPAIDPPPILVEVDDGVTPYLATVVPLGTGGGQFEWDRDTHTLSLGTDPLPAAGTTITLGPNLNFPDSPFTYYTVQFPFKVIVPSVPPTPRITYREARPDCVEYGPALEIATGILARESQERKDLEVVTDEDGFLPGQALTVDTTARYGLDADYLIASVRGRIVNALHWEYGVTAQAAAPDVAYQGSHVDQWKALTSGGGGGTSSPAVVTAPVVDTSDVVESDLSLSDITTANVSTTKHGFAPKAPGDATKFLNGANPPAWTVPSGSGGALVRIDQVVTSGSQATVDFSSIPNSYSALVVEFFSRDTQGGTSAIAVRVKINNDATSGNYTAAAFSGVQNGAGIASTSAASVKGVFVHANPQDGNTAGIVGAGSIHVAGYAGTTFHKVVRSETAYEDGTANLTRLMLSARWKSTAAINQLTFSTDGTAFKDGSVFTLYGVA